MSGPVLFLLLLICLALPGELRERFSSFPVELEELREGDRCDATGD